MSNQLLPGYQLRVGSSKERTLLVKFMQQAYQEIFPSLSLNNFSHLAATVNDYFSAETPLWWVEKSDSLAATSRLKPVACLWIGNAIDQVQGDRYAHVFLLYVVAEYRRQGIGSALMNHAQNWARARGDRQIGLNVFQNNQPALKLYFHLGYQTQSLFMVKPLLS